MRGEHGLKEVRLLALRGKPRRRTAALDVNTDQGQLGYGGQPKNLLLQTHPRTGRGRHGLPSGKRCTHDCTDARDFILRLQPLAAVTPELTAERLHDLCGRRDRIAAEE